jgi:hypothetical protein
MHHGLSVIKLNFEAGMSSQRIDQLIVHYASRHDGLVPLAPLYAARVDSQSITRRTQAGLLLPVSRGVRRVAQTDLTPLRRSIAAVLVTHDSWVSHTAALDAYGAVLKPRAIEAHVSSPTQIRIAGVRSHRTPTGLSGADRLVMFGVSFSQPWQAVVESAAVLDADQLAVAMDSLMHARLASVERILRCAEGHKAFHGRNVLIDLLEQRRNGQGMVRSFLEQDLDTVLRRARLPLPTRNFRVTLPNGRRRFIDTGWPEQRVGLEAHSWKHHSNPTDWGATMIRDRELTVAGWTMLSVVVADTRKPETLIQQLREVLIDW